jgi:hypothetical protein
VPPAVDGETRLGATAGRTLVVAERFAERVIAARCEDLRNGMHPTGRE